MYVSTLRRDHSGSVVECLTQDGEVESLTSITALCPWARHINHCLVLVQPRKTRPDIIKNIDWDVKNQIKQTINLRTVSVNFTKCKMLNIKPYVCFCTKGRKFENVIWCKFEIPHLTFYSIMTPLKYHVFENNLENFGVNAPFSIIFSKVFKT